MRLFKKRQDSSGEAPVACVHGVLIASWDRLEDMGNDERVSRYRCEACGQVFTPEEGRELSMGHREHAVSR